MNIVVLDGGTTNPGDLSWEPLERLGRLTVYGQTPQGLAVQRLEDAQAVILNRLSLGREEFSRLPKLRYVGTLATGYNTIDVKAARERGITVCNVPHYCEEAVAQHALSLLLCLCNKVQRSAGMVRDGHWAQAVEESHLSLSPVALAGKRLGIVGYGSTGQRMAALGLALGMEVLLFSRREKQAPAGCRWVGLETLFQESDAVSLHCPLTEETRGLVGRKLLALMKPTAFLINTRRAPWWMSLLWQKHWTKGGWLGRAWTYSPKSPQSRETPCSLLKIASSRPTSPGRRKRPESASSGSWRKTCAATRKDARKMW